MESRAERPRQSAEALTEPDDGLIELCLVTLEACNPDANPEVLAEGALKAARMLTPISKGIENGDADSVTVQMQVRVGEEVLELPFELHETTDEDRKRGH